MTGWYVLKVTGRTEDRVVESLRNDFGFDAFCPKIERRASRYAKRTEETTEPAYPGYILCRKDIPWRAIDLIRNKRGDRLIVGPVRACGEFWPVSEAVVGKIATDLAEYQEQQPPEAPFKVGDHLTIEFAQAELPGEVVNVSDEDVEIGVKLFNRITFVTRKIEELTGAKKELEAA